MREGIEPQPLVSPQTSHAHFLHEYIAIMTAAFWLNYTMKIRTLSNQGLVDGVLDPCYELAEIAKRKYELLKWAIWIGAAGAVAASCVLLGI